MIRKAYDNGVRILSGSESGFALTPYGHWHGRELEIFVNYLNLTPVEAITTATKNGAWAMQMEDDLGTIEEGKLADVIIVDADPVAEITALNDKNRINEVIINGKRLELDGLWPEHEPIPGWKVGNWAGEILTWEKAYEYLLP